MSNASPFKYPLSVPDVGPEELFLVQEALRSVEISGSGSFVAMAEQKLAEELHAQFALVVSNGTAALQLALMALGIGAGDEVILPTFSFVAAANAVTVVGATPRLVDVDDSSWNLNLTEVEQAIGPRTRAVIAVHNYGHPSDLHRLGELTKRNGLQLIEDNAESLFARRDGLMTGSVGDVSTYSFFGNKVLTCGEGGAVTTNDVHLADKLRLLRGQGMDPTRRYYFTEVGLNFRLSNVLAAILCGQLNRKSEILTLRGSLLARYSLALSRIGGIRLQPVESNTQLSPWLQSVTVTCGTDSCCRGNLMAHLSLAGVETRPLFIPMHELPTYCHLGRPEGFPVSEELSRRGLSLPLHPRMTSSDVDNICELVCNFMESHTCDEEPD